MQKIVSQARIYRILVDTLERSPLVRAALIEKALSRLGLTEEDLRDRSVGSAQNVFRSRIGGIINDMHAASLIGLDSSGRYYLISARPVIIRIERCEKEILKALTESPMKRTALRERLKTIFGTDKTATTRDDDTLSTYIGQILKRLCAKGVLELNGGIYSLSPKISAKANDINAMLALKSDFLARIHSKGGEFFENYFMTLLSKYTVKKGKNVLECYVTGGTSDGGIDGVMKTEDSLGFRETTMVQTKNRVDIVSETDVRGFYGAVCAKRGTRGIFATTSTFHAAAEEFLLGLDDCVGICGNRIFAMATECLYGIKRHGNELVIDNKII